jgi:hypothetical protein
MSTNEGDYEEERKNLAWWCTSVIPALRLREKDHGFVVSLSYIGRSCLKKQNKTKNKR